MCGGEGTREVDGPWIIRGHPHMNTTTTTCDTDVTTDVATGRVEPRARKRRPKQYDLLNKPREELRRKLQGSPGKKHVA